MVNKMISVISSDGVILVHLGYIHKNMGIEHGNMGLFCNCMVE